MRAFYFALLSCSLMIGCASTKYKDLPYLQANNSTSQFNPKLNVFLPRHSKGKHLPVLIFIHGGNWNSGSKDTYGFYARNFTKKGVVTVIPDYTLSPNANYDVMATQVAAVIKWVTAHITEYDGDPRQVFVTGHSAGGHLAALAVMNPKYGIPKNTVSGIILNDAAGLDMKTYLERSPPTDLNDYTTTWTTDPARWKDASPIYFLDKDAPPFLIYVGDKTYQSIKDGNQLFLEALHSLQPKVAIHYINKKHIPMVVQYVWPWSKRFDETISFMRQVSAP